MEPKLMMSDSLVENISPEELRKYENRFILVTYDFDINGRIESVLSSLVFRNSENNVTEIHAKTNTEDGFALNMVWPQINLVSYSFKLGDDILDFSGPFVVSSIGIKDIDHERRNCILTMKIVKKDS